MYKQLVVLADKTFGVRCKSKMLRRLNVIEIIMGLAKYLLDYTIKMPSRF
jgi:hypothetical protein